MKDMVGNIVFEGDLIAHVTRLGSYIFWKKGRVTEVHADHIRCTWLTKRWSGQKTASNPVSKNFVVIEEISHE